MGFRAVAVYNRGQMEFASTAMPCRILVIDDDPISLAIAAVMLEAEGCAVLQAESGEQALELLPGNTPPECILADLRMPGLSGPELATHLRSRAPGALLLAMSASPPPEVEGYHGVLQKPLSPESLRAAIDHVAEHATVCDAVAPDEPSLTGVLLDEGIFGRLRRSMSPPALAEVVGAFLEDTATRIADMRSAAPETVCRQAHTVKGGAAMLGAAQVSKVASIIETGIDQPGERLRKLDELEYSLRETEVILKQRLKI
ncbi:MAG TPA: response regulator [Acidobacteriaceae bacterium]|nr:response regulator [Acidobacteriaceae bacterium]